MSFNIINVSMTSSLMNDKKREGMMFIKMQICEDLKR